MRHRFRVRRMMTVVWGNAYVEVWRVIVGALQ